MNVIIACTLNILGICFDPFEFRGNYGPEANPIRERVFELLISQEAVARNLPEDFPDRIALIAAGEEFDRNHGPTFDEIFSPAVVSGLYEWEATLNHPSFTTQDVDALVAFLQRHGHEKAFYFMRNSPKDLSRISKILIDYSAREGIPFDLPILSSTSHLYGSNSAELALNALQAILTSHNLSLAHPHNSLEKLPDDLSLFATPAGQLLFFWMYQSVNMHIVSSTPGLIDGVNKVKRIFANTLGDTEARANYFRRKFVLNDVAVVFSQECDGQTAQILTHDGLFHDLSTQNLRDGTHVFLHADHWEANYEVHEITDYARAAKGAINAVVATHLFTGEKFLLAACHGDDLNPADGREQISLVMAKFHQLKALYPNLQLIIGTDANTKSAEQVADLRQHLDTLGLVATSVGPTTVKERMVTMQHSKSGRKATDEEDFIITLKEGDYELYDQAVGFKAPPADPEKPLPNKTNPSDHYPVSARLVRRR